MFGAWLAARVTFPERYNASDIGSRAECAGVVFMHRIAYIPPMFRTAKRNQQQQPQLIAAVACVRTFGFQA
jgi:hypothetical protein